MKLLRVFLILNMFGVASAFANLRANATDITKIILNGYSVTEKGQATNCSAQISLNANREIVAAKISGMASFRILFIDSEGKIGSVGSFDKPRYSLFEGTVQDEMYGVTFKKSKGENTAVYEVFNGDERLYYVELEFNALGGAKSINYQFVSRSYGNQQQIVSGNCLAPQVGLSLMDPESK